MKTYACSIVLLAVLVVAGCVHSDTISTSGSRETKAEEVHQRETPPPLRFVAVSPDVDVLATEDPLEKEFALDQAPEFNVSAADAAEIAEIIEEVRGGYGGTLVCADDGAIVDQPAFLAHYLRAFATPDSLNTPDLQTYDYRMERVLSRMSGHPTLMSDSCLDWFVWRSYLQIERLSGLAGHYRVKDTIYNLDDAEDLLWEYLDRNLPDILNSQQRLEWWLSHIMYGMKAGEGKPKRKWLLLKFISATDTETHELAKRLSESKDSESEKESFYSLYCATPSPYHPFLMVEEDDELPDFPEMIKRMAKSQSLKLEVLGVDPNSLPPTKAIYRNIALGGTSLILAYVVDEQSWQVGSESQNVSSSRPVGTRSGHSNVTLPTRKINEGLHFHTFKASLLVWPNSRMEDAIIMLLGRSGLITKSCKNRLAAHGFKSFATTLKMSD